MIFFFFFFFDLLKEANLHSLNDFVLNCLKLPWSIQQFLRICIRSIIAEFHASNSISSRLVSFWMIFVFSLLTCSKIFWDFSTWNGWPVLLLQEDGSDVERHQTLQAPKLRAWFEVVARVLLGPEQSCPTRLLSDMQNWIKRKPHRWYSVIYIYISLTA